MMVRALDQREIQGLVCLGATASVFAAGFATGCLWLRRYGYQAPAARDTLAETQAPSELKTPLIPTVEVVVESPDSTTGSEPTESVESTPRGQSAVTTPRGNGTASKLLLLVRTDLPLTRGQTTAYVGKAALGWFKKVSVRRFKTYAAWDQDGAGVACYGATSEAEMVAVRARAKELGVVTAFYTHSKGPPEAKAVLAVGPVPAAVLADVVSGLIQL